MSTVMKEGDQGSTTYILKMKDGTRQKITVPDTWKVTFGPIVPGKPNAQYSGTATALRFYEGNPKTGKQHACFVDVESFRSNALGVLEEKVETKRETVVRQGDESGEQMVVEASVKEWVNPDAPKQRPSNDRQVRGSGLLIVKS